MNINMKKVDISIYEMQIKIYQTCDKHFLAKENILALFCYFQAKIAKMIEKLTQIP